jgi:hypothetical protein
MTVSGPIGATLAAYALAGERVFEARGQTVGGSEVGQCARKIFYLKHEGSEFGSPRDPGFTDSWGARLRGSTFETAIFVPAMRAKFGDHLLFAGDAQQTLTLGFLSATPDALIVGLEHNALVPLGVADIGGDGSIIVEVKTIDPRAKLDGPKPEHAFQVQVQLGLIRALTNHQPEYAVITYTDASFWDLTREFAVRFDPQVFEAAQQRATKIMTARFSSELLPEGWIAGGRECERCPFTRACGITRAAVPTGAVAPPKPATKIIAMARRAKRREAALDAATAALRKVQHEIKETMRAAGVHRVAADGVSVIWSAVKGRPSYDMSAIRTAAAAAGIDINQFETVGAATDRLVIQIAGNPIPACDLNRESKREGTKEE